MRAVFLTGLFAISMTAGHRVEAATDWTRTCAVVGNFAGLVAVQRDQNVPAEVAVSTARRILGQPRMITQAVGDEIAHQVYSTPQRSPEQENGWLRSECLVPVSNPERPVPRRAKVEVLTPVELNVGNNLVAHFTPDGRDAVITLKWQEDGGGHGHDVFAITVAGAGPVMMPSGGETVRDDPEHDRDMRSSVRFARGQVDGTDATLLLTATRQPGAGATPTIYRVFTLARQGETYRFVRVLSEQLAASCNADMALSVAAGLPLRRSYRGAATANGCPPTSQVAREE